MSDCECSVVVTADCVWRGEKRIDLKKIVDEAVAKCPGVTACIIVHHSARLAANVPTTANGNGLSNGVVKVVSLSRFSHLL